MGFKWIYSNTNVPMEKLMGMNTVLMEIYWGMKGYLIW